MSPNLSGIAEALAPARLGRPFRWLLASSWASNLGDGIALAAGPLLVASETHDPFLVLARGAAVGLEDAQVGTGHLLLGLLRQPGSAATAVLAPLEINVDDAVLRQRMATGG